MNAIFGIPMSGILIALAAMLGFSLLTLGWAAWRRPVIFKLGVRNIPRRRAQTILIVVGLMLSTAIIAAALGIGDTLNYSATASIYQLLGRNDEIVVASPSLDARADTAIGTKMPASALAAVEAAVKGDPNVAGVMPMLFETVPVVNVAQGVSEPNVVISGIDPARLDTFGGLIGIDGKPIDLGAIPVDSVVLSEKTASKLFAKPGDQIILFYSNQPVPLKVAAIAKDSALGGVLQIGGMGMAVPLARLQPVTHQENALSLVSVANVGGVRGGMAHSDAVTARLRMALTGQQLGVDPFKQRSAHDAQVASTTFMNIFMLMGLFSIAAGMLLIVLIFAMLAAERRAEMGMERAVGARRGQLIEQFVAEGAGYALLAGLAGSGLGLLAAVGITTGMKSLFGESLPIVAHIAPRSLVVAYCLGVVITFGAVAFASWQISRLTIVAAVRDLPEVKVSKRKRSELVWAALMLIGGPALIAIGIASEQLSGLLGGLSLLPLGAAFGLRYFGVRGRLVFSAAGVLLLVLWLAPNSIETPFVRLFGPTINEGIEMFFLSGLFLVLAATIVIVQNTDVILAGISALGGLFRSTLPAVKTAVAYPVSAINRTGLTIAMFCLIVFSLVMMATMNTNFVNLILGDAANAGWDVRADAGSANPISDFRATLQAKGVDPTNIASLGIVTIPDPAARLRMPGGAWRTSLVHGMDASFITNSKLSFQQRAAGYPTDASVIRALLTQPDVAVIDASSVPNPGSLGRPAELFTLSGVAWGEKSFAPTKVEISDPRSATPATVTVIAVIDTKIGTLFGLYVNQATIQGIFPSMAATSFYVALRDPGQAASMARQIERALLANGVQAVSIRQELADNQRQTRAFFYLMEGFMALGLIIGVAAVGVIAFRSVVERRQQIGVLRAIGFQPGQVALTFLIETGFVVGVGVIMGTVLGLVLGQKVFTSDQWGSSSATYIVPWSIVLLIVVASLVVAELMAWIPARQAARTVPAQALRYE